jgi:hypothetical protein
MQANRDSIMKPAAAERLYRRRAKAKTGRHKLYGARSAAAGVRFMFRS